MKINKIYLYIVLVAIFLGATYFLINNYKKENALEKEIKVVNPVVEEDLTDLIPKPTSRCTIKPNWIKDVNGILTREISGAEPSSFSVIKGSEIEDCAGTNYLVAIDKNNVYCAGSVLENADPKTLKLVDSRFIKDENNIYDFRYGCSPYDYRVDKRPDDFSIDVNTFEVIKDHLYYRDKNDVYMRLSHIETEDMVRLGADPNTFQLLGEGFSRDKNNLFFGYNGVKFNKLPVIMEGADPDSFEIINEFYSKDRTQVYFIRIPYEGFNSCSVISGVDPESFEVLTSSRLGSFSKDKDKIYFRRKEYNVPDISTVRNIEEIPDAIADKDNIYIAGGPEPTVINFVDMNSFKITDSEYKKFNDGRVYEMLAEDKNNKYLIKLTNEEDTFSSIVVLD